VVFIFIAVFVLSPSFFRFKITGHSLQNLPDRRCEPPSADHFLCNKHIRPLFHGWLESAKVPLLREDAFQTFSFYWAYAGTLAFPFRNFLRDFTFVFFTFQRELVLGIMARSTTEDF